ncbi:MAG: T9SS type A sorting domain-containing protein [Bacteroidota bacterium]
MRLLVSLSATLLFSVASTQAQSFEGLGDLPGGDFRSQASAVSADGTVVVGQGRSENGVEAFRWTRSGAMEGLGGLPGGDMSSGATDVSADGSAVVGTGDTERGDQAFRWTRTGGMEGIAIASSFAEGVSADGTVAVGTGQTERGDQAFRWRLGGEVEYLGDLPGSFTLSVAYDVSVDGSVIVGYGSIESGREAFRWTRDGGMEGLGTLPGGDFRSEAYGVSADGAVVVGRANSESGIEAFRWTRTGGMEGLGYLSGESFFSQANDVSADGSVVVGVGILANRQAPFIWTAAEGMRALKTVLEDDYGLDLSGWELRAATAVSADGSVIVGYGTNPSGDREAWRAEVPRSIAVTYPNSDVLVPAGEPTTLRWTRPSSVAPVDVYLLPDTLSLDGGPPPEPFLVAGGVAADSLVWTFPGTYPDAFFSRAARIAVVDAQNATIADTSAFFRVRPYHLVRLSDDGSFYVPYEVEQHGWTFANTQDEFFPESWYAFDPQFNYFGGEDPFTSLPYDPAFALPPANGRNVVFPDWPAFARAFGTDAVYVDLDPGVAATHSDAALTAWGSAHGGDTWGGSCSGLATSELLAFALRDDFGSRYPAIGPVETLATVPMSTSVREAVNELFAHQYGAEYSDNFEAAAGLDPRTVLALLQARLLDDDPAVAGTLNLFDVQTCSPLAVDGGHAVVPYRLERDADLPGLWVVYVHDSNEPDNEDLVVAIDANANRWSYGGFDPAWGGACGLFLGDPVVDFLTEATPNFLVPSAPAAALQDAAQQNAALQDDARQTVVPLFVGTTPGVEVALSNGVGTIGYDGTGMTNSLVGARPQVPLVGGPAPPYGYTVPHGTYTLTLGDAPADRLAATFIDDGAGRLTSYDRRDASPSHTDRFVYDPIGGPDESPRLTLGGDAPRSVHVRTVLATANGERTLDVRDLRLTPTDSASVAVPDGSDGPRLVIENAGAATTYTVRLREAAPEGAALFIADVELEAGATHTVRGTWGQLGREPAVLEVDLDSDGVAEETRPLANQVANEDRAPGQPTAPQLAAVFPNPAASHATLRFGLSSPGRAELAVYDLLGRRVAVLAEGPHAAGWHDATLDAVELPSGVYVARLVTDSTVQTRSFTLIR